MGLEEVLQHSQYPVFLLACIVLARWYLNSNERLLKSQDETLALVKQELKDCHQERTELKNRVFSLEIEIKNLKGQQ